MPAATTVLRGIDQIESFMKAAGGSPGEWQVGLAEDGAFELSTRDQQGNPYATTASFVSEDAARAAIAYFLRAGAELARDGFLRAGDRPRVEVFAYRLPRPNSFREFLQRKAKSSEAELQRERRAEWISAVEALLGQIEEWLRQSDPDGLLQVSRLGVDKLEQGLGAYQAPGLQIQLGESWVRVVPVGRNVAGYISPSGGTGVRAAGRVDVVNGTDKHILYRARTPEGGDIWYALSDRHETAVLDRPTFEGILQDLLS